MDNSADIEKVYDDNIFNLRKFNILFETKTYDNFEKYYPLASNSVDRYQEVQQSSQRKYSPSFQEQINDEMNDKYSPSFQEQR
jgi:hypothetical protein